MECVRLGSHGLVAIDDFDIVRIAFLPEKADAPLLVDSYAVLTFPITGEAFQMVARRNPQVVDVL